MRTSLRHRPRLSPSILLACLASACLTSIAAAQREVPQPDNPYITYSHPTLWTLKTRISLGAYGESSTRAVTLDTWSADTVAVIFPLLRNTASSTAVPEKVRGGIEFNDRAADTKPTIIGGYHSGAEFGRWDAYNITAREMELEIEVDMVSYETQFNEQAAMQVDWPTGEWPDEAKSALEPQLFVERMPGSVSSGSDVQRLLDKWTNGQDPKQIKPVLLAKFLAGQVQEHARPSGNGIRNDRYYGTIGLELRGADETARRGEGSPFDVTALLVAIYRKAGIPAKLVIGFDQFAIDEERSSGRVPHLRSWVEFCLYDEKNQIVTWIPVDVVSMRKSSSRARALDTAWDYFGTNDESDDVLPFALHFHPPTTVRAYGYPAFFGWLVTPTPPSRASQRFEMNASRTPSRSTPPGGD